jgi:hypothetical protein
VITFAPYILPVVLAAGLFIFFFAQGRSLKQSLMRLEVNLSALEAAMKEQENTLREEVRKTGGEKDLKISQLRDDLRTTLNSFVESTGKKLAETAAAQKSQLEVLSARISALDNLLAQKLAATKVPEKPEPAKPEPAKPEPVKPEPANQLSTAHEKAKRLARLIVSDILLYNQAAVEEGVKNNTLAKLLSHDIQEARALYAQRVPEDVRKGTTYLEQAFSELIARKKKELGIA